MPIAYNGIPMPSLIYGTAWKKEATTSLVQRAIEVGFRGIDTANQLIHYDEARVGRALTTVYEDGLKRGELFLQTKFTSVGGQDHRTPYDASAPVSEQVRQSMDSSLSHLNTDYVDSYLLHGPYTRQGLTPADWQVWQEMEALYQAGKTRMIGVSNVNSHQLRLFCDEASTRPMVVQNRCYAIMGWDRDVRAICRSEGIIYQGFSLLTANPQILAHPSVRRVAERLGADPAQIIFRFAMSLGMVPLTGTTSEKHMKDDLAAEHLVLTDDEISMIETMK